MNGNLTLLVAHPPGAFSSANAQKKGSRSPPEKLAHEPTANPTTTNPTEQLHLAARNRAGAGVATNGGGDGKSDYDHNVLPARENAMTRRGLINDLPVNDESVPGFSQNLRANAWLKKASELKKGGNLDAAIKALESAEVAINEGEVDYAPDTFCRLPMYLQEAGRGQEAVDKLIALLDRYPSGWGEPLRRDGVGMFKAHIESHRGTVYDKLRLVLQREKRYSEAIPYAILAETYRPRVNFRIYKYLAEKWEGKEAPVEPDLGEVKADGGTFQDYMKEGEKIFEWDEYTRLRDSFEGGLDSPELPSVATLLKKMGQRDHLPEFQDYAKILLGDFKKQDSKIIAEVYVLLER